MSAIAKKLLSAVIIGLVFCALAYWWYLIPIHFRYRLTIDVAIEGQIRTASSVIGVDYWREQPKLPFAPGPRHRPMDIYGTAPMMEIGSGGVLMAGLTNGIGPIIRGADARQEFTPAVFLPLKAYKIRYDNLDAVRNFTAAAPVVLAPEDHPVFVWIPPVYDWRSASAMYSSLNFSRR